MHRLIRFVYLLLFCDVLCYGLVLIGFINCLEAYSRLFCVLTLHSIQECIICFEDHSIGDIACKLPCGHLFHPECLKDWLEKQASCPICRYELETDDVEFEMQRKKRMRER